MGIEAMNCFIHNIQKEIDSRNLRIKDVGLEGEDSEVYNK